MVSGVGNWTEDKSDYYTSAQVETSQGVQNTTINAKALPGTCSGTNVVQNTTITGVECVAKTVDTTIGNCSGHTCAVTNTGTLDSYEAAALLDNTNQTLSFSGDNITISDGNEINISSIDTDTDTTYTADETYINMISEVITQNESVLNDTIDARSDFDTDTFVTTNNISGWGYYNAEINLTTLLDNNYIANGSSATFSKVTGTNVCVGAICISSWDEVNKTFTDTDTFVTTSNISAWGFYNTEINLTTLLDDDYEGELDNEAGLYAALSDVSLFLEGLVNDTTPQLGGTLDANGNDIGATTDEIEDVYVGDDNYIYYGDGQDCKIGFNSTMAAFVIDCT